MNALWKNDSELFALGRAELYTAVVGDIMDLLGHKRQFLPPAIQPLREDMIVIGRAMPVLARAMEREFKIDAEEARAAIVAFTKMLMLRHPLVLRADHPKKRSQ
ncbi:MAG: hypothetical protein WEB60_13695 [Terrimicrobiaceae bacterium]